MFRADKAFLSLLQWPSETPSPLQLLVSKVSKYIQIEVTSCEWHRKGAQPLSATVPFHSSVEALLLSHTTRAQPSERQQSTTMQEVRE